MSLVKMYKKDGKGGIKECRAEKRQVEAMQKAGWSTEKSSAKSKPPKPAPAPAPTPVASKSS